MKASETFDNKYLGRKAAYIAGALFLIAAIIYLGYVVAGITAPSSEYVDAVPAVTVKTIETDGYIFRDEKPVYSSVLAGRESGSAVAAVQNGTKISAGTKIAEVYSSVSADTVRRISELEDQIKLLEKYSSEERSLLSANGVDEEIYGIVSAMRKNSEDGDYANTLSLRSALLVDLKKKDIITGEITDYESQIRQLEREVESLRNQLGTKLDTVYSSDPGYYFISYDGYGNVFDSKKIETLNWSEYRKILSSSPETVSACVGTIVKNYRWYVSFDTDDVSDIVAGRSYDVFFSYSNETISMTVERIISDDEGKNFVVIMSTGQMPDGFDYTRMQPIKVSTVSYSGYRIPKTALRVLDGYQGVYVRNKVDVEFKRVNIIYEDGMYVICTGNPDDNYVPTEETQNGRTYGWIKQNDIIIVNGTDIFDGKAADQVN